MGLYFPTTVGKRYAYYSSLATHPQMGEDKVHSIDAFDSAEAYLRKNLLKLRLIDGEASDELKAALDLLKKMADNELAKERRFLATKMKKIKNEQVQKFLQKILNSPTLDYTEFIYAINALYLNTLEISEKIEREQEELKIISNAVQEAYARFRNFEGSERLQKHKLRRRTIQLNSKKFTNTTLYLYGDKKENKVPRTSEETRKALRGAAKNLDRMRLDVSMLESRAYDKLREMLVSALQERPALTYDFIYKQSPTTQAHILNILDNIFIMNFRGYLYKINRNHRVNKDDGKFYTIRELISNRINPEADEDILGDIQKAISESLDFLSNNQNLVLDLSKDVFGESMTKRELERERKRLLTEAQTLSADVRKFLKTRESFYTKSGGFKESGTIVDRMQALIDNTNDNSSDEMKEYKRKASRLFNIRNQAKALGNIKTVKKSSLAISAEKSQAIESAIQGAFVGMHLGGRNTKDDTITYTLEYFPPVVETNGEEGSDSKVKDVEKELAAFVENLENDPRIRKYDKNGAMDTESLRDRLDAHARGIRRLDKKVEDIKKNLPTGEDLKIFVEHGTTKEYNFLNNNVGFFGGSLGANDQAESAINNIYLMFRLGGIKLIDQNWLIFAAMNTASHLIAGDGRNIVSSLELYLSIIAGVLMFNDSDAIVKEVSNKIFNSLPKNVEQIHVYRLEGYYFPLSYILQETYQDLVRLAEDITRLAKPGHGNRVNIYSEASWRNFHGNTTQDDWEMEGQRTLDSTRIKMTFMAGFLDILEGLKIIDPT